MANDLPGGLVWVTDQMPGIRRRRRGQGFVYIDPQGSPVRDSATLQRIRRLAVPPAYAAVWICPLPEGHLQATGRDARGRKQYRYHPLWQAERGATKFDQLRRFGPALSRIRRRVQQDLRAPAPLSPGGGPHRPGDPPRLATPTRDVVMATLVRLLDTTWMRIGNEAYARHNRSYGLTTLRCNHAGIDGSALILRFRGKGGVLHELQLDDARVARVVRRCRELPGQELFQYVDEHGQLHRAGSAEVNAWLAEAAGERVTAKDFRTWHASVLALQLLLEACAAEPGTPGVPRSAVDIVAAVARRLGNTPAVCRKAYIHPRVLELAAAVLGGAPERRAALLAEPWVRAPGRAPPRLRRAEAQLLALLRRRAGMPLAASQHRAAARTQLTGHPAA
ncbi:DNA topoisomerase IB [Aquabacterium humicola]|uniref:DNA topoisomerase IB n=1 Tax=Aquabacterium humicola TaxID=3237377 RepID=UPI0025430F8A|nr:DNA topoisomerase IB [Rubrivivax pictus]